MKNSMLIFAFTLLLSKSLFGQIILEPTNEFAECPDEWINYTVTYEACGNFFYTVTDGVIQGGQINGNISTLLGGTSVLIRWNSDKNEGQINVEEVCGETYKIWNIPIRTPTGIDPGGVNGNDTNIAFYNSSAVQYSIPPIYLNRGNSDPNPLEVTGYEWSIPSGWSIISGANDNVITLQPNDCSAGEVKVRGVDDWCNNGPYYSNWSIPKTITRYLGTTGTISGPGELVCSDQSAVTYTISQVPGVFDYTWNYPAGWSVSGSANSNTITLIPDGMSDGQISVTANGCTQTSLSPPLSVNLILYDVSNPPLKSGPELFCTSGTFQLNNPPSGATITWTVGNSSLVTPSSGTGTIATLNKVSNGNTYIKWTASGCGVSQDYVKSFHVGPYSSSDYEINGPSTASCNEYVYYNIPQLDLSGGGTINWVWPSEWTYISGQGTRYLALKTGQYTGAVAVGVNNICGPSGSYDYQFTNVIGFCNPNPYFSLSPNPATSESTITMTEDTEEPVLLELINDQTSVSYRAKFHSNEYKIPLVGLRKGVYLVRVTRGNLVYTDKLFVK